MAKDKPAVPTDRNLDSESYIEISTGSVIVVGKGETVLHPRSGKSRKVSGPVIRSISTQRIEISVLGSHIIFEPRARGPVPKVLLDNDRFKEAAKAYNLTEVKEK